MSGQEHPPAAVPALTYADLLDVTDGDAAARREPVRRMRALVPATPAQECEDDVIDLRDVPGPGGGGECA